LKKLKKFEPKVESKVKTSSTKPKKNKFHLLDIEEEKNMKIRTGFVSNSSSASFIVRWKFMRPRDHDFTDEPETKLNYALHLLLDIISYDYDNDEFIFDEKSLDKSMKPIVDNLLKNTTEISDWVFETSFFTAMFNDPDDFGEAAKMLCLALMVDNGNAANFEVVRTFVERDG
jgi:hypothetical protein